MASAGIRILIEQTIRALLDSLVDLPVIMGANGSKLPWEYVLVEAGKAQHLASGTFKIPVSIQVMGTADKGPGFERTNQNFKAVVDYLADPACQLRTLSNDDLIVSGYFIESPEEIRGTRTYGEQLNMEIVACEA
jgi:hypothetical protein